jgi:F-type H+-transporting ATPase subunit gamma
MPGLKDLKQRIKGIQGMRKVTKAMQLVSAAKMRKAQDAVVNSRTYSGLAWELISDLSSKISTDNPLLTSYPNAKKIGVVILTTNRGLVGSLNTNLQPLIKKLSNPSASATLGTSPQKGKETATEIITEMVVYGKNAKQIAGRMNKKIMADFQKAERRITSEEIYPIAEYITAAYKTGEYRQIVIVYNKFVSTLVQKPSVKQLLPFENDKPKSATTFEPGEEIDSEYIFEPTPQIVLDHLLPRIIESQLYQTILESDASEHSARMVMMKNATEAAGDLIDDYKLTYNQLRQGKITTELSEITAGRIALE